MLIYQLVFGVDSGQVLCAFHDDTRPSAGIGPNGEYNCFKCGVKAHDELGFICKYFGVGAKRAARIKTALNNLQNYKYSMLSITSEQRNFLRSIGIVDSVIDKYFFSSAVGKLIYKHIWNGFPVGYTWFNNPSLSNYNASADKYHYDKNNVAGFLTPYDDVIRYKWLVICEGEKDMLTAKSFNIPNAVAKVGGAKSYIIGGVPLRNKSIVLCYDCDEAGREGAIQDATILTEQFGCRVKIVDLNLQDKEDLNDYFMKYNKTYHDFYNLIKTTPIFVPQPKTNLTKVQKFVDSLNADELIELEQILKIRKGEN